MPLTLTKIELKLDDMQVNMFQQLQLNISPRFSSFSCQRASARRFKKEHLHELKERVKAGNTELIKKLSTKHQGRPLLFKKEADCAVQEYIKSLKSVGSSVNTWVVMAAAEGIIPRQCPGYLKMQGGPSR